MDPEEPWQLPNALQWLIVLVTLHTDHSSGQSQPMPTLLGSGRLPSSQGQHRHLFTSIGAPASSGVPAGGGSIPHGPSTQDMGDLGARTCRCTGHMYCA